MKTRRIMRAAAIPGGSLHICALLVICALFGALPGSGLTPSAWAQAPDNRGVKLNPEDSVPPAYRDTLDERDRLRLDEARRQGESFVPVVQGQGRQPERKPPAGAEPARPENGTPTLLPEATGGPAKPQAAYEAYRPRLNEGGRRDGSEDGISDLMNVLLQNWNKPPEIVRIRYPAAKPARAAPDISGTPAALPPIPLPPAGDGIYSRTIYAVNSDYPGPVLIELLGPPLAGAVATGAFTLVGERMVLRLTSLEYRGRRVAADGWAVGLDCACYGIAGEIDSHFFQRVLLPAAMRFAEGFLTAMGRPAESVTLGSGDVRYERRRSSTREAVHSGLGTAARAAGGILLENAPKRPTVRIPRETELIVMFASPHAMAPENGPDRPNLGAGGTTTDRENVGAGDG